MIKSRKSQLVIGLIVACTCGLALCAEPNETKTDAKFEINNKKSQPWRGTRGGPGRGPVKPTHVATFHVRQPNYYLPTDYEGLLQILKTSTGKSLSEQQRQFLSASDAMVWQGVKDTKNHDTVLLYAVSTDDAKKMVQAFLDVAASRANDDAQHMKTQLNKYEEEVAKAKKELPQKEAKLEAITVEYEVIKKKAHNLSSDPDAAKESKETMLEMNRVLDSLAIEITGIEAKLSAVERIKSQKKVSSIEGLAKLEEIKSEQTVELAGALARKKAAIGIREREEEFYDLYRQRDSLLLQVGFVRNSLTDAELHRQDRRKRLANMEQQMLPPKFYQDKVIIYPVLTE